jgi:hypothetical protein
MPIDWTVLFMTLASRLVGQGLRHSKNSKVKRQFELRLRFTEFQVVCDARRREKQCGCCIGWLSLTAHQARVLRIAVPASLFKACTTGSISMVSMARLYEGINRAVKSLRATREIALILRVHKAKVENVRSLSRQK